MKIPPNHLDPILTVFGRQDKISMKLKDVSHLKAWSNYTFINHKDKKILSAKTLGYYYNLLNNQSFIRTHKSYCVNIDHIERVDFRTRIITLFSGDEIPLARSKKKAIKEMLGQDFLNKNRIYKSKIFQQTPQSII